MTNEEFEIELRKDIEKCGDFAISISFNNHYMFLIYQDSEDDDFYCVTFDILSGQRVQVNRVRIVPLPTKNYW